MPIQSTLAGSFSSLLESKLEPVLKYLRNLSPLARLCVTSGVVFVLFGQYLRVKSGRRTSGCALASRLSEDPTIRVLMLEAGGSGTALVQSRTPSMYGRLFHTKHVYGFRTEPQVFARGKTSFWPRAKMLGGCSSMNAQMAQYGAPGDFDDWAQIIEDDSWSWKNLQRYFRKFERYMPHPEYPLVDASYRGKEGPIRVGYNNHVASESRAFIKSCVNVGIPFTPDFNGPNGTLGVSRVMTYVDEKYQRVSSESAYLTSDVLGRKNLTVAIHATVTRIIFEEYKSETQAVGVEFATRKGGQKYRARAKRDVVLCAGSIHSPHILMLSGVGPAKHLQSNNIPVVLDHPGVGQNLTDHVVADLYFKNKSAGSLAWLAPHSIGDVGKIVMAALQYFVMGNGGPMATNLGESAAFIRSDDRKLFPSSKFPDQLTDSASAKDSPDLELFTTPFAYKEHGDILFDLPTYALHCYLLRPMSTGEILLKSNDPWQMPSLNPNYLKNPDDLLKLVRGVRVLLDIAHSEPLSDYLDHACTREDLDHQLHLQSDAEIAELIRERSETVYHPTSTCRMAPKEKGGVVDSKLRVYGIKGLRVCDASIFPSTISGHTAGACYVIAEKLADEMKAEYNSA
ncbi:hypothetical protein AGABI2DRAFT_183868 [Agaricus bisporus var. bisporus H97]|uniref:hypothetical protein n=1 Tax=Agaricus bisporus var. bisporus (strain H97 / ATCC MYA-4626 / FGSC 10389) TaxID=936046 RepID=UPI00029F7039|nr:hypothetical protein AGABI2DRAFT_183868 [Agaricus bisporus var. bisporus H97]EKV48995.1 hypothetical protein AGABI2DRAFT_183868 [Agaricus bisporus var. bisporus H97]